jgi:hypothetical protein
VRPPPVIRVRREHLAIILEQFAKEPTVSPGQVEWLRKKFASMKLAGAYHVKERKEDRDVGCDC